VGYPRTAAATEATKDNAARIAATVPAKRERAARIVGHALAAGTITPEDLARAVAASAPTPSPELLDLLRALLPPVRPDQTDAASRQEAA
jgi:hypothetical protein